MAKKKSKNKNNSQQKAKLSPERFMREKARSLPIGKCYVTSDWKEDGMAQVVITRKRSNGNLVMGAFLVDTFCLGVKDSGYNEDIPVSELEECLDDYRNDTGIEEISYNEAHNIIYGAMAFAEEGGIKPSKEFYPAGYILEEDTEDIPLIEYDFGKDGKHFLVIGPDGSEKKHLHTLQKNLGDDFDYVMETGDSTDSSLLSEDFPDDVLENMKKWQEESARHPDEVYSYQYPEYPEALSVKNQFIADELLSPDNYSDLSREVIDRILALPADEAAEDIGNVVMYEIGRTYKDINDDTIDDPSESAIMHALILLAHLNSEKGLDAVLEIMRQRGNFADYHLGDFAPELIHRALYSCGRDNIRAIEEYLYQPGLDSYLRTQALYALAMIVVNHPERRDEIIDVFRRLLVSMVSRLPERVACDGEFAGFVMSTLMDINARELIPEIKDVFGTDCVNRTIAGDCDKIVDCIESGDCKMDEKMFRIDDIYEQYDELRKILTKTE